MNIAMLQDYVLLELSDAKDMYKGTLFIPDTGKDSPQTARVVAVGPGRWVHGKFVETDYLTTGDLVIFPKYEGATIEIEEKSYIAVRADALLAILDSPDQSAQ